MISALIKDHQNNSVRGKVLIVGGGIAGLSVLHELQKSQINAMLVESTDCLGGVWSMAPHPAIYSSLILNTSTQQMGISDFNKPVSDGNSYLTWKEYARFIEDYIRNNIDLNSVYFNIKVTAVRKTFLNYTSSALVSFVATDPSGESIAANLEFDYVVMCIGECNNPWIPLHDPRSDYQHSNEVKFNQGEGQSFLLVGFGNTAGDLAETLSLHHNAVDISAQNPTWVVPKNYDGRVIDNFVQELQQREGNGYPRVLLDYLRPHLFFANNHSGAILDGIDYSNSRIVKNSNLISLMRNERVRVKPPVEVLSKNSATFIDGTVKRYDEIIFCTGFSASVSLVDQGCTKQQSLLANIFDRNWRELFFAGTQPLWGGTGILVTRQARIICHALISGRQHDRMIGQLTLREKANVRRIAFPNGIKLYSLYEYMLFTDNLVKMEPNYVL